MSTTSRTKATKRPNPKCRETSAPRPYLHVIPFKLFGLWRSDKGDSHNYKPHGKFGGCTKKVRALRKLIKQTAAIATP